MSKKNGRPKPVRCAIYTRKSTEEGLDMDFNSLDAQREAGESYIASQKEEGWKCISTRYDDGGFTGGNMERPALTRLMADVERGKVDCIVVYKVDRLSRSLLDFARIMEALEQHGVSFVSVTQHFNTTHSMGRLTLNILLSFAQFEREIISERTRDKIAATRRKGKWSGGRPMLGYDIEDRCLVINEEEASKVRAIFDLYLEHQSLSETAKELNARGWTNKRWTTKKGHETGGSPFGKGGLMALLTNAVYIGKMTYKDEVHEGEHSGIVDEAVFERVQEILKRNGRTNGAKVRNKFGALLKGILHCTACDCTMNHSHTKKGNNRRYRYYVCMNAQKNGWTNCPSPSVPAQEIEEFVVGQIKTIGKDETLLADTIEEFNRLQTEEIERLKVDRRGIEEELRTLHKRLMQVVAEGDWSPETGVRSQNCVPGASLRIPASSLQPPASSLTSPVSLLQSPASILNPPSCTTASGRRNSTHLK